MLKSPVLIIKQDCCLNFQICNILHCVKMPVFEICLIHIFENSGWVRRFTEWISILTPNARKYGREKLRIRTLLRQCYLFRMNSEVNIVAAKMDWFRKIFDETKFLFCTFCLKLFIISSLSKHKFTLDFNLNYFSESHRTRNLNTGVLWQVVFIYFFNYFS